MVKMLKRIYVWLTRSPHSRGFGVQSPSAYRFIRYVINEHYPYYAYKDLSSLGYADGKKHLFELYFRLVNDLQPDSWIEYPDFNDHSKEYVAAGCKKINIVTLEDIKKLSLFPMPSIIRMSAKNLSAEQIIPCFSQVNTHSLLVVEDIHFNNHCRQLWQKLQEDQHTGVSYDLYYVGLLFFDHSLYKQHYIVNF